MILSALLCIWGFTASPLALEGTLNNPSYMTAAARQGDGVYALLRRYNLDQFDCNFDLFYEINGLSPRNARLYKGRLYKLPLYVYQYDGVSIRSTIGVEDWPLARTIQSYNREMQQQGLRSKDYTEDRILWVPNHLLRCADQPVQQVQLPATPPPAGPAPANGARTFAIFGPQHAYVPLVDTKLRGKVFYIVSGHGGPDPGAVGQRSGNRLCEDEYAYDVALRLCRNLLAHGATAYMITRDANDGIRSGQYLDCDTDEVVWGNQPMPRDQKERLTQRSNVINNLYEANRSQGVTEQYTIVIHVDSRSQSERTDLYFYHHGTKPPARRLAQRLQQTMRNKYRKARTNGNYHGTVTTRDLHMLRECKTNTVYIELANIRNTTDQQRIVLERNRQLLALWLLEGILDYF